MSNNVVLKKIIFKNITSEGMAHINEKLFYYDERGNIIRTKDSNGFEEWKNMMKIII